MNIESGPLTKATYDLVQQIESCGASPELTRAVIMAGELGDKVEAMELAALRPSLPMGRGEGMTPEIEAAIKRLEGPHPFERYVGDGPYVVQQDHKALRTLLAAYRLSSQGTQPDPQLIELGAAYANALIRNGDLVRMLGRIDQYLSGERRTSIVSGDAFHESIKETLCHPEPEPMPAADRHSSGGDGLEAEVSRLRETLDGLKEWAAAYPVSVFPEPDMAKASASLEANGQTLDAVSASNFRYVLGQITERVDAALSRDGEGGVG